MFEKGPHDFQNATFKIFKLIKTKCFNLNDFGTFGRHVNKLATAWLCSRK